MSKIPLNGKTQLVQLKKMDSLRKPSVSETAMHELSPEPKFTKVSLKVTAKASPSRYRSGKRNWGGGFSKGSGKGAGK